jgi:peptidoglycan/xylan/chitin deacetylase (PgdA/CDA1 family)
MRIITCFFAILMAVLAGCVSQKKEVAEAPHAPSPVVDAVEQAADRWLAFAMPSAADLRSSYSPIMEQGKPDQEIALATDRLVRIYFRAQSYLKDFDRRLDEILANPDTQAKETLFEDSSYLKLMASWYLSEEARSRLVGAYAKLVDYEATMAANRRPGDPGQARAEAAMKGLATALQQSGARRLALQPLYRDLWDAAEEFRSSRPGVALLPPGARGTQSVIEKMLIKDQDTLKRALKQHQLEIDQESRGAEDDVQISEEVDRLAAIAKSQVFASLGGRSPQNMVPVAPGPGPSGNINGRTFKAGRWALTYDDGPVGSHSVEIIKDLNAKGLKATFFWLANRAESGASVIRLARESGMDLANHSFSHKDLSKQSEVVLRQEIVHAQRVLTNAYGRAPKLFRCPYGACGPGGSLVRQMIANEGMIHVFWTVDSLDWQDRNPDSVYERVMKQMRAFGGGIMLFHDIHPQTVAVTRRLTSHLAEGVRQGSMRVLTVQEAVNELNSPSGMR